jgi:hypothetical protein
MTSKALNENRKLADEFGELQEQLAPYAALKAKADNLRAKILFNLGQSIAPDEGHSILSASGEFQVDVEPRKNESSINAKALARYMGLAKFVAIAKVAMKDLLNALPGSEAEKFITTARTGPRVVTSQRRGDIRA